jgi:hypothetical protein
MAAACNDGAVGGSGDHVRDVALIVAAKKVDCVRVTFIFSSDQTIRLKSGGGYSWPLAMNIIFIALGFLDFAVSMV